MLVIDVGICDAIFGVIGSVNVVLFMGAAAITVTLEGFIQSVDLVSKIGLGDAIEEFTGTIY